MHELPSSQGDVFGAFRHWPVPVSQLSLLHGFLSSHDLVVPDWQVLLTHTSPEVQALPSSQGKALATWLQVPSLGLHAWSIHLFLSSQSTATPASHLPAWHASFLVHGLPSLHAPLAATATQPPVLVSQLFVVQTLLSSQPLAAPAWHWPAWHTSLRVHGLPSSQLPALAVVLHLPVATSQPSRVQALLSSHATALPGEHTLLSQASPAVQALASALQAALLAVKVQPSLGSHASSVHGLPSLQVCAGPAVHKPVLHASPNVHTFWSASHVTPSATFCGEQLPVFTSQALLAQAVSALVEQVTIVAGFTLHCGCAPDLSQNSVPLQKFPSSSGLQSSLALHVHVAPTCPETHAPALHASPVVHGLPSSQAAVLLPWPQPSFASQVSVVKGF